MDQLASVNIRSLPVGRAGGPASRFAPGQSAFVGVAVVMVRAMRSATVLSGPFDSPCDGAPLGAGGQSSRPPPDASSGSQKILWNLKGAYASPVPVRDIFPRGAAPV